MKINKHWSANGKSTGLDDGFEKLFRSDVLKLAANVATKTSPFICFIRFWMLMHRLWVNNNITLFEFIWLEPIDFMHEAILQAQLQIEN